MTEEHKQKIRQTLLRLWHGENWTEEDQEKFERERNTRYCKCSRNRHRGAYTEYQREYQKKFREENPYYYGYKRMLRKYPNTSMTYEEYIEYRKSKEK
jgi:hypothetical protein